MNNQTFKYMNFTDLHEDPRFPFSKGQLRCFIFNKKKNGLDSVVIKIGKRLYIRDDKLIQWMESHTLKKQTPNK